MRRCAFLTMDSRPELTADDALIVDPVAELGWTVDTVPWCRREVGWGDYDAVVVRSTWDYHRARAAFLESLAGIERETSLENPASLIAWNSDKRYLFDLEERGVPIVPTRAVSGVTAEDLGELCDELGGEEFVLKPTVGASADGVLRVSRTEVPDLAPRLEAGCAGRAYLVQPFVPAIADEGEYSVLFLAGDYSHTVLKRPGSGDFRVQEELGGRLVAVDPETGLVELGRDVLRALETARDPLYARVDVVRLDGAFRLMEVELIEPALFLGTDEGAPSRFAAALDVRYG